MTHIIIIYQRKYMITNVNIIFQDHLMYIVIYLTTDTAYKCDTYMYGNRNNFTPD